MIKTALRPYQGAAVEKALGHDGFALFLEQRTGKTLVTLAIVDRRKPDLLVVICPKKAIKVWEKQFEEHLEQDWPMEKLFINFEQVIDTRVRRKIRRLCSRYRTMVVIDESHRIKRRGSKQSRTCRLIGREATWRLALTGTPIAQGLHDAWAQFDFLDPLIFGEWKHFQERYCVMGGFKGKKVVGYRNREAFERLFHRYSYRKTLNEARQEGGKRPVIVRRIVRQVQLGPDALRAYQELENDLVTTVQRRTIETPLVITLVMKLQQITGGFLMDGKDVYPVDSAKLEALWKELAEAKGKMVIVCRFIHEIRAIEASLRLIGKTYVTIAGGVEWDGTFETDVALLQVQSGVAIDLANANLIVFYSWDYSFINYEQTRFRVLSYERTRVTYVYLMAENTIDQQIYEAVTGKKDLATLVCDHYRRR